MSVVIKCDRCNLSDNKINTVTGEKTVLYDGRVNQSNYSNVVWDRNICEECLKDLDTWLGADLTRG